MIVAAFPLWKGVLEVKTTVGFVPLELTSGKATSTLLDKHLCQRGGAGVGVSFSCNLTSDKKCLWLILDFA